MGEKATERMKFKTEWLIKGISEGSKDIAEDFSSFWRPLVRLITTLAFALIVIFTAPYVLLIARFLPKGKDAYSNVRTELETVWYEKSSMEALQELRNLKNTLYADHYEDLLKKGVEIQPYGVFKFNEYFNLLQLLYHYEIRHKNYAEAGEVCDEILKPYVENERKMWIPEKWFVNKAKTIAVLRGPTAAQEFLLPYVDNEKEESYIRKYFLELRGTPKEEGKEAL